MTASTELVRAIEADRRREAGRARLERLADCARRCCTEPASLLRRLVRVVRRAPDPCAGA